MIGLKEKIQKVCNEENLALKATSREHSPLTRAFSSLQLSLNEFLILLKGGKT